MFTFHSAEWWCRFWEKTNLVEITACYNIDDPKGIWMPWAKGKQSFSDEGFLNADTDNDVAFVVMAAKKKGIIK